MRRCNQCQTDKPLEAFHFSNKSEGKRAYICKECQRGLAANWYERNKETRQDTRRKYHARAVRENRAKILEVLKQSVCADCGYSDIRALDFDHVRGTKRTGVLSMVNRGFAWATIAEEITKCEVVCCNCHRIRTAKQFNWSGARYGKPDAAPPALRKMSAAAKARLSEQRKGRPQRPETVERRAEALRGRPCSEETKRKISERATARYQERRAEADSQGKRLGRGGKIF